MRDPDVVCDAYSGRSWGREIYQHRLRRACTGITPAGTVLLRRAWRWSVMMPGAGRDNRTRGERRSEEGLPTHGMSVNPTPPKRSGRATAPRIASLGIVSDGAGVR